MQRIFLTLIRIPMLMSFLTILAINHCQSEAMHNAIINKKGDLVITASKTSGASDFDFLIGDHLVHHKKLKTRLSGSQDWAEFDGRHSLETILEGRGNLEQHFMQEATGRYIEGAALRLFDPRTRLWTIHWSDSRNCRLDVPVVGSFEGNVGYFYAKDLYNGAPIIVQFKWDASNPAKPVWSQAFSKDQGRTWEWNWYMYFTKSKNLNKAVISQDHPIGVIEIRNYVMKRGKRDTFIKFFENNFVESQDSLQGYILGRYRVSGKDDNFCWIRGFKDMSVRSRFLPSFYHGPVWRKNRNTANGMLANNDNVYLLKPLELRGDSLADALSLSSRTLSAKQGITVVQFYIANSKLPHLFKLFSGAYLEDMKKSGFSDFSLWTSEMQQNTFPQLPVFQDKNLMVVISFFKNEEQYRTAQNKLAASLPEELKSDFEDTVTMQNTWILYPTEKSLGNNN